MEVGRIRQFFAKSEFCVFVTIAKQPVMAYFHKPRGKDMDDETPYEFVSKQIHNLTAVFIFVITPFETNYSILNPQDPAVGNSNPVSIASEILYHTSSVPKRRFAINHPLLAI